MAEPLPPERIRVFIQDPSGNQCREARIAANAPVRELIPALITALQLPTTDPSGQPITYRLMLGSQRLQEDQTALDAGVSDGHTITLVPEVNVSSLIGINELVNAIIESGATFGAQELLADFEKYLLGKQGGLTLYSDFLTRLKRRKPERTATITLRLEIEEDAFGEPEQNGLLGLLALAMGVSRDEIRIISIASGSIQLTIEVPEDGIGRLVEFLQRYRNEVTVLGISKVRIDLIFAPPSVSTQTLYTAPALGREMVDTEQDTLLAFLCDNDDNRRFSIEGGFTYQAVTARRLGFDPASLNHEMQFIGNVIQSNTLGSVNAALWYEQIKNKGQSLYNDVFMQDQELLQWFGPVRQIHCTREDRLILWFGGPRWHLGCPYEILWDEGGPLIVRYPLCRHVSAIGCRKPGFARFLAGLTRNKEPLRVLLIASSAPSEDRHLNTRVNDNDNEVEIVQRLIKQEAERRGIRCETRVLLTTEASYGKVENLLKHCPFHIVHFVGEAFLHQPTGQDSGLWIWKESGQQRDKQALTAYSCAYLLSGSETMLFFLSTGVGMVVGDRELLRNNDFLGLVDALVMAGVPYVFGYRWHVPRNSATRFAEVFYQALFNTQSPARALWYARREFYIKARYDPTWVSAMLVSQPKPAELL